MALTYFTLAELRALPDMADDVKYPDTRLTAAGEWVEAVIEREVGTSFVAREVTDTLDGDSADHEGLLLLSRHWVLGVVSVIADGVTFEPGDLVQVELREGTARRKVPGAFTGHVPWPSGTQNIVLTYNAGYSGAPPADVKDAALQGARYRAIRTASGAGISDRATSITNEFGNVQLATPGTNRPTGLPEVDAVVVGWRDKLALYGFG